MISYLPDETVQLDRDSNLRFKKYDICLFFNTDEDTQKRERIPKKKRPRARQIVYLKQ